MIKTRGFRTSFFDQKIQVEKISNLAQTSSALTNQNSKLQKARNIFSHQANIPKKILTTTTNAKPQKSIDLTKFEGHLSISGLSIQIKEDYVIILIF